MRDTTMRRAGVGLLAGVLAAGGLVVAAGPAAAAPQTLFTSTGPGYVEDAATVPAGICFVTISADGGEGGSTATAGGLGAVVTARVAVTPGAALDVMVAGEGGDGTPGDGGAGGNGGVGGGGGGGVDFFGVTAGGGAGGGGASAVSTDGAPLVVAGGGGAASFGTEQSQPGGAGGLVGADGGQGAGDGGFGGTAAGNGGAAGPTGVGGNGGGGIAAGGGGSGEGGDGTGTVGGGGGGQGEGGAGGTGTGAGGAAVGGSGSGGAGSPPGGNGAPAGVASGSGGGGGGGVGFGGGAGGVLGTGGGGGGYGGGGSDTFNNIGGGGGGSSFAAPGATITMNEATATGDGAVTISYDTELDGCAPEPVFQPDATLERARVGDGIYNTTGDDQTRLQTVEPTRGRTWWIYVQNDGNTTDDITIQGTGPQPPHFNVVGYRLLVTPEGTYPSAVITSEVIAGTFTLQDVPAGGEAKIQLAVNVGKKAPVGTEATFLVTATSVSDPTRTDTVRAIMRVG